MGSCDPGDPVQDPYAQGGQALKWGSTVHALDRELINPARNANARALVFWPPGVRRPAHPNSPTAPSACQLATLILFLDNSTPFTAPQVKSHLEVVGSFKSLLNIEAVSSPMSNR